MLCVYQRSDNFSFVVNSHKIHEAGYDAYISGYGKFMVISIFTNVFLKLKWILTVSLNFYSILEDGTYFNC